MICYFTRELDSDLSPAYVFSSFTDEHDHYIQDWAEQAVRECKNLMNGLCGGTLSESLQSMFNDGNSSPTPNQVAQLALVITSRKCFGHQNLHSSYFQAINLEDPEFWESLAVIFEKKTGSNLAENLKGAFLELAKPGEITYPRGMSFELIREAGYNLMTSEGGHFYLCPGHDVNIDFDDTIHTEFLAREDAIASAYGDLIAVVCKFHKLTSDDFVSKKFDDKCLLIKEAFKPFIAKVKASIEEQLTQS